MREKSNSITHLVKIVATEVFEELVDNRLRRLETERNQYNFSMKEMGDRFCQTISTNVEKAGRPWPEEEDKLLVEEVKIAVAQIALNHKRSRGAIGSRIRQKELIISS